MIHEFLRPIPCLTKLGPGYIWYVTSGGYLENDEFTVILTDDCRVRHLASCDVTIWPNGTYGIGKPEDPPLPF